MDFKTVPISVRIKQEDADFLAGLQGYGVTPSDKVRSIIMEARRKSQLGSSYAESLEMIRELLAPMVSRVRAAEGELELRSEMVSTLPQWIAETTAFLLANAGEGEASLQKLEAGLLQRVAGLSELLLRMAVTSQSPTYDSRSIRPLLGTLLELAAVIQLTQGKEK